MSENYLNVIEQRLREMFAHVADGTETVDDSVAFLKDEIHASYKRGQSSIIEGRGKARSNAKRPFKRANAVKR